MSDQIPKRDTVGKIATDLLLDKADTLDPIAIEREAHKDYAANIYECVKNGIKVYDGAGFYVVVETKKERLLENVLRNFFFHRMSCPTPNYDQTVYYYSHANDHINFLWVVPSQETCEIFKHNVSKIIPDEYDLLKYVLDFEDGTLLKLAKSLNREQISSIIHD